MRVLVIEYKLISFEYFMDKLQSWEVDELLDSIGYADRGNWEQTRLLMYIIAQVNSTKKLSFDDMIHFPWEKEKTADRTDITDDEVKRLQDKANFISQNIL